MTLQGKIAIVTGGGGGIGRATALLFAEEGAKLCIVDVNEHGAAETASLAQARGSQAIAVPADVTKEPEVQAMAAACLKAFGRIDILFSNAGTLGKAHFVPLHELPLAEWRHVMDVNLTGMFLVAKYVLPVMVRQDGGVIVNTASTAGVVGNPNNCVYVATKHGVVGLTKYQALHYAPYNIRANCVAPGATDTALGDLGRRIAERAGKTIQARALNRVAQPEEIAQAALYLASDRSSFVTGACLVVDGGLTAA